MNRTNIVTGLYLAAALLVAAGCHHEHEEVHHEPHQIIATSPVSRDMVTTQQYVSQIHSCRHIEVRAIESGYLEPITIKEGQSVNEGDVMFNILPVVYQARLNSDKAEARQAEIEFINTQKLFQKGIVSDQELALVEAKWAKAKAKVDLAQAELNFASLKAPFSGIIDRLHEQQGSLVEDGDMLTTLSDNSVMWVYFPVPEKNYLEYMESLKGHREQLKIELKLANGNKFNQVGEIGAIEADFNNITGNILFRADFQNPERLLRHGQTGTILISRVRHDAVVIPQRAVFDILAKQYVFVIDEENKVHQREIHIDAEQDDIYILKDGVEVNEKIVLEGIRQVREDDEVEFEFQAPEQVLSHLKYAAE